MIGLLFVVATLAPSATESKSYADAYRQHKEQGKPLVVLVGASWCPACRTMKGSSIPAAIDSGALEGVAYAFVDADAKRGLANRLMRGSSIPQLIMFYDTPNGPRRVQLTGAQDPETIRDFVAAGVEASAEVAARQARQSSSSNSPAGS